MELNIVLEITHALDPDQIVTFEWRLGSLFLSSSISTLLFSYPSLSSSLSRKLAGWWWGDGTLLKAPFLLHAVKLPVCTGSSWNENCDGTRHILFHYQRRKKSHLNAIWHLAWNWGGTATVLVTLTSLLLSAKTCPRTWQSIGWYQKNMNTLQ